MGDDGTDKLEENLLSQQERLLQQLSDIEELKNDLDDDEYIETKTETLDQIAEIAASLQKLRTGNITLSDQLCSQKKEIMTAISNAFRTPEVLKMFARREPDQLRQRLIERERDYKLGKLPLATFNQDKKELLEALRQLGESLTPEQSNFLGEDKTDSARALFEPAPGNADDATACLKWARQEQ